jgi:hypothetical protein
VAAEACAVETDLETGAGVEEQEGHWEQCENEEKEEGQTGIGQVVAAEVGHVSLVEEVEPRQWLAILVIEHYRQKQVHRHTENLDIGEEEKSGKGVD